MKTLIILIKINNFNFILIIYQHLLGYIILNLKFLLKGILILNQPFLLICHYIY